MLQQYTYRHSVVYSRPASSDPTVTQPIEDWPDSFVELSPGPVFSGPV